MIGPSSLAVGSRVLEPQMCWQMRKIPARWPDCNKSGGGSCSTHEPDRDYVKKCDAKLHTNTQCNPLVPTTQGSSTRRKMNCPNHRPKSKSQPNAGSQQGGNSGSGSSMSTYAPGLKVGA